MFTVQVIHPYFVHTIRSILIWNLQHHAEPSQQTQNICFVLAGFRYVFNNGEFLYSAHTMPSALHTQYTWSCTISTPFCRMQHSSHFGARSLSHTFPSLSYQVLIYTQSEVKHVRVKYIAQGHTIEKTMSQNCEGGTSYFSVIPAPSGYRTRTAGSGYCKALRCFVVLFCERARSVAFDLYWNYR